MVSGFNHPCLLNEVFIKTLTWTGFVSTLSGCWLIFLDSPYNKPVLLFPSALWTITLNGWIWGGCQLNIQLIRREWSGTWNSQLKWVLVTKPLTWRPALIPVVRNYSTLKCMNVEGTVSPLYEWLGIQSGVLYEKMGIPPVHATDLFLCLIPKGKKSSGFWPDCGTRRKLRCWCCEKVHVLPNTTFLIGEYRNAVCVLAWHLAVVAQWQVSCMTKPFSLAFLMF